MPCKPIPKPSNFIEKCLSGKALLDDIDDFIDEWHDGDSKLPLYQFLGMTKSEYSLWMADPEVLPYVINAHSKGQNFAGSLPDLRRTRPESPSGIRALARELPRQGADSRQKPALSG